ncbi:MAG: cytochrome c family protein [Thermoguttaceae bacterium]|jgi:mono/diheme cytochrome c family protein
MMARFRGVGFVGVAAGIVTLVWLAGPTLVRSQPPAEPYAAPAVPTGQTYTGAKRCSSCHFKQFMAWKKTKHAKEAWESVTAKYQSDPECLKCHVTGYGVAGGYAAGTTPEVLQNLLGTTCEACHGPGSKHEEIAKKYTTKKKLEPDEEKEVRGSVYKVLPQNVCIQCHTPQSHKDHPKYDKS